MDILSQSERRPRSPKPLPGNIAVTLRERIHSGMYPVGYKLPSERTLVKDLSVDRRTVRAAIEQLSTEGILDIRPNCRPMIKSSLPRLAPPRLIALVMLRSDALDSGLTQQRIFWGINEGLSGSGLHVVYLDLLQGSPETYLHRAEQEAEHLSYVLKHGFEGVVFYPQAYNSNRDLLRKVARRVPLVLIDRQIPGVQADFVGIENRWSTLEATRHLINQGHKRVAFLTSGEFSNKAQERLEGYFQALNDAFPGDPYEMILTPPLSNSPAWPMFEAMCRLPLKKRPTGIVCSNNHDAARAASYLRALKIRVPEDVSLIDLDNIGRTPYSNLDQTGTEQPFEIGKAAAKLILRRCQDPSIDLAHIEFPASLVAHTTERGRSTRVG